MTSAVSTNSKQTADPKHNVTTYRLGEEKNTDGPAVPRHTWWGEFTDLYSAVPVTSI